MGSSHSSPSRYGFSFCYVSSYDSCVELGRLSLVLFRFCTLTVIRTIKSVFLLSSSSIFASFICFSWTLELSAIILLILLCSPFIQDLKSNTWNKFYNVLPLARSFEMNGLNFCYRSTIHWICSSRYRPVKS
jgi:hypothetical protein